MKVMATTRVTCPICLRLPGWVCCSVALGSSLVIYQEAVENGCTLAQHFPLKKKKIPFLKCFQIFYISFPFLSFQPPPFSSPPCGPGDHPVSLHDIMREN